MLKLLHNYSKSIEGSSQHFYNKRKQCIIFLGHVCLHIPMTRTCSISFLSFSQLISIDLNSIDFSSCQLHTWVKLLQRLPSAFLMATTSLCQRITASAPTLSTKIGILYLISSGWCWRMYQASAQQIRVYHQI